MQIHSRTMSCRPLVRLSAITAAIALGLLLGILGSRASGAAAAHASGRSHPAHSAHLVHSIRPAHGTIVRQVNLVSDRRGLAARTDARLVNPWGIAFLHADSIWIANNGKGLATEYNGRGVATGRVIAIPPPAGSPRGTTAAPTGLVVNRSRDFVVRRGKAAAPSVLLFATEDGTIAGWNPRVNSRRAILAVDNSRRPSASAGAVYKGLALGRAGEHHFLYAANFRAGRIDVFDARFRAVRLSGSFHDAHLPAGYAPFNIANLGGELFVSYAQQNGEQHDDVAGAGHGFVDVYSTGGHLLRRLIRRGRLDSPWGMVIAPRGFGAFGGDILVGNFGNGHINAYDPRTGAFRGEVTATNGRPFATKGLWGLAFAHGSRPAARTTLFFTAGIDDEQHGLFGGLVATR
jgi:uncharacterized protein (TIGR03118 family)